MTVMTTIRDVCRDSQRERRHHLHPAPGERDRTGRSHAAAAARTDPDQHTQRPISRRQSGCQTQRQAAEEGLAVAVLQEGSTSPSWLLVVINYCDRAVT